MDSHEGQEEVFERPTPKESLEEKKRFLRGLAVHPVELEGEKEVLGGLKLDLRIGGEEFRKILERIGGSSPPLHCRLWAATHCFYPDNPEVSRRVCERAFVLLKEIGLDGQHPGFSAFVYLTGLLALEPNLDSKAAKNEELAERAREATKSALEAFDISVLGRRIDALLAQQPTDVEKGIDSLKEGDLEKARTFFKREFDEWTAKCWLCLADVISSSPQLLEDAEARQKAIEATEALTQKRFPEAEAAIKELEKLGIEGLEPLKNEAELWRLFEEAQAAEKTGEYMEAYERYKKISVLLEKGKLVVPDLTEIRIEMKLQRSIAEYMDTILEKATVVSKIRECLEEVNTALREDDFNRALEWLNRGLGIVPDNEELQKICGEQGRKEASRGKFHRAFALFHLPTAFSEAEKFQHLRRIMVEVSEIRDLFGEEEYSQGISRAEKLWQRYKGEESDFLRDIFGKMAFWLPAETRRSLLNLVCPERVQLQNEIEGILSSPTRTLRDWMFFKTSQIEDLRARVRKLEQLSFVKAPEIKLRAYPPAVVEEENYQKGVAALEEGMKILSKAGLKNSPVMFELLKASKEGATTLLLAGVGFDEFLERSLLYSFRLLALAAHYAPDDIRPEYVRMKEAVAGLRKIKECFERKKFEEGLKMARKVLVKYVPETDLPVWLIIEKLGEKYLSSKQQEQLREMVYPRREEIAETISAILDSGLKLRNNLLLTRQAVEEVREKCQSL